MSVLVHLYIYHERYTHAYMHTYSYTHYCFRRASPVGKRARRRRNEELKSKQSLLTFPPSKSFPHQAAAAATATNWS